MLSDHDDRDKSRWTTTQLELARLVGAGWTLLPLHPMTDYGGRLVYGHDGEIIDVEPAYGCTCHRGPACPSPGKHPESCWQTDPNGLARTPRGVLRHWPRGTARGVAVQLGESGPVCIDIDPRNGGDASWLLLLEEHGLLPPCPEDRRGGVSPHYYLSIPEGLSLPASVQLAPGVELLSGSHIVVVPPSPHLSGVPREWVVRPDQTPPPELPVWVVELARKRLGEAKAKRDAERAAKRTARPPTPSIGRPPSNDPAAIAAALYPPGPEGVRHDTLKRYVASLRARCLDYVEIERLALEWAARCTPPLEVDEAVKLAAWAGKLPAGPSFPSASQLRIVPAPADQGDPRPAPSDPSKADRPGRRSEERCIQPMNPIMERLKDGQVCPCWTRCGRGSCPGCLTYPSGPNVRRLIHEPDAAVWFCGGKFPTCRRTTASWKLAATTAGQGH